MKPLCILAMVVACAGCATAPPPPSPEPYFQDGSFGPPSEPPDVQDLFKLSPEMDHFLHFEMAHQLRAEGPARGLVTALYRHDQLKLEYDSTRTRNAAQAFAARQGNCLSLVIMTAAFAKALGLQVSYQNIAIDETWGHVDDIAFLSTHVNLALGPRSVDVLRGYAANIDLTIDFFPPTQTAGRHATSISEATVIAMYMNNRAVEAMVRGQIDDAYWWARGAVARSPGDAAPYNTLGVVYLRHGDLPAARQVFTHLLALDPRDRQALSNQAQVMARLGHDDDASALRQRLVRLEPVAPYRYLQLGLEALERGDLQAARTMFAKEVDRADYCSECHFWLGIAELRLGDDVHAREQLRSAVENSTTTAEHALYAAKLERLKSHEVH